LKVSNNNYLQICGTLISELLKLKKQQLKISHLPIRKIRNTIRHSKDDTVTRKASTVKNTKRSREFKSESDILRDNKKRKKLSSIKEELEYHCTRHDLNGRSIEVIYS
jgi:hypothetical protein